MKAAGITLIVLGAIALAVALFVLYVWVLVWNLTDIQNVGFNFWNVFWIALATSGILGGASRAGK